MKNDEIGALRRDVITEASLKGVLLLAVVAFVCVFSLGRQTWPPVFFGIVSVVLLGSIVRRLTWARRVIMGYVSSSPVAMEVQFQVGEILPDGGSGGSAADHPVPAGEREDTRRCCRLRLKIATPLSVSCSTAH